MKDERDTRRSRNARLNLVHKSACALAAWANPEKRPQTEEEWSALFANMRDAANDLSQAVHESSAYHNVLRRHTEEKPSSSRVEKGENRE